MTTYIRPAAVARDDADMIAGWNISPNTGYQLQISATSSGAVVILLSVDGSTLIGSGVAAVGTAQPVTITPMSGQAVGMADATMGWHMLLTTAGTEGDRTITMDAMVDLSARTHPVYADDDLALAVGTADINAGTHYTQDVTASCPLGFGASVGDTASVPVDGSAVVGQVESFTWTGTPDGTSETAVIRRHTAIAPEVYTPPPAPPVLADDTAETDAATATSGNVLANDTGTLTVSAVNGLSANVGEEIAGSDGGVFVVGSDGSWTFNPSGDFSGLSGSETAATSVSYHASNGQAEASATLTVTVRAGAGVLWTLDEITTGLRLEIIDPLSITIAGSTASQIADRSGNARHAAQATAGNQATYSSNVLSFDAAASPNYDYYNLPLAEYGALFFVVKKLNANDKGWLARDSRTYDRDGLWITSTGATALQRGSSVGAIPTGPVATIGQWNVVYAEANGTTRALRVNGGAETTVASAAKISLNQIGYYHWVPPTYCFEGQMAFVVGLADAPGTELRQTIEGYLAHAVDSALGITRLVDALPSDHPYKSAPPYVE